MPHDRVFDRMNFIAQFELRALIEELLAAPDEPARQEVAGAMRVWLRTHCASCGTLIDHALRRAGEAYCFVCFPPPPPDLDAPAGAPAPPTPDDRDVPF
jgi:hypothetical protein